MKTSLRLALPAVTLLTLAQIARAQTTPTDPRGSPGTPATTVGPAGSFDGASPTVKAAVTNAVSTADAIRASQINVASPPPRDPRLTTAVTQANNAIVTESVTTRSTALTQRQATLTRLRLAASEAERQRLIDDLRVQSGQRLEEQREAARLVRDRIRALRDLTTVNRPPTP